MKCLLLTREVEMKVKCVKGLDLPGALSAGASQIVAGDLVSSGDVIAAALSSAGVLSGQQ